jgi:arylsulfatase A-like enzyme
MPDATGSDDRPNVLWVLTDQHNARALGYAGHPDVETPNLDRLAAEGVAFERAYCPSPVCGPARASLFAGEYPREHGFRTNNDGFDDRRDAGLLPGRLSAAGYHAALAGKLHFTPKAAPHGFDRRWLHDAPYDTYHAEEPWTSDYVRWLADRRECDRADVIATANDDEAAFIERGDLHRFLLGSDWRADAEHANTWVTDRAVEYLRDERPAGDPFFLFASYFGPHQPMRAPGEWAEMYDPEAVTIPETFDLDPDRPVVRAKEARSAPLRHLRDHPWPEERYREVLAAYFGQISMIDRGVGRLLDELERQGIREDTVVVFAADHGEHMGQFGWFFKGTMYEGAARVPLVVSDPARPDAAGERTDRVVNTLDLYATLAARCGLDPTPEKPSRDLGPLLADPDRADWADETFAELPEQWLLVGAGHKLIRARTPGGDVVHELYDLSADPVDGTDVWGDPDHRAAQSELVRALNDRRPRSTRSARE